MGRLPHIIRKAFFFVAVLQTSIIHMKLHEGILRNDKMLALSRGVLVWHRH